ncbi:tRNA adenosine(34) deaminase TadA [Endozoicomonas sp. G2_1]|uniref:tRNA adenosine(34) deaminase TadA n=1 Tax=Endozoicomonas sp. G2_1 TaxID=2821091 RepID=UPI001FFE09EF|nr:tRNA adenosine(34) deaminase TadA [Endozoicomonas sp. G2_1]
MSIVTAQTKNQLAISFETEVSEAQQALDRQFMAAAFEQAKQAEAINEIPVGAIVVADNHIIGRGYNRSIIDNDPSAHAEMLAIRQAGQVLDNYRMLDCTLYVTLEPCPMCAGLLVHSRIKRLVFASDDLKTGASGSAFNLVQNEQLNHNITVTKGVMAQECSALLSNFFKRRRQEIKARKKAQKKAQNKALNQASNQTVKAQASNQQKAEPER